MDRVNSVQGYGKVDPAEEAAHRKKTRQRRIIILLSLLVLAVILVGVGITLIVKNNNKKSSSTPPSTTASSALKAVCKVTQYPDSCYSSISALNLKNTTDPEELFRISLHVVIDSIQSLSNTLAAKKNTTSAKKALEVCQFVLDDALDRLNDSLSSMDASGKAGQKKKILPDLKTWLSTTITDQETCLDALAEFNATALVGDSMNKPSQYASNSLSIVAKILGVLAKFDVPVNRRLLGIGHTGGHGFPEWVSSGDRRLLQEANPTPNVTVAKDGTGDCTTISEAVEKIPKKSDDRFVIYVKAGEYIENNLLDKSKWNVMIYGDGKDKTILSGSLNFIDGTPTFATATLGKILCYICFTCLNKICFSLLLYSCLFS